MDTRQTKLYNIMLETAPTRSGVFGEYYKRGWLGIGKPARDTMIYAAWRAGKKAAQLSGGAPFAWRVAPWPGRRVRPSPGGWPSHGPANKE